MRSKPRAGSIPAASMDPMGARSDMDAFEAAYTTAAPAAASPPGPELAPRAAPAHVFALHGCVLTPDRRIENGCVVVGDGSTISAVEEAPPADVPIQEAGVILPGLIDLHGHPAFNVFAPWEPPQRFANRYEWRGSDLYRQLIRDPQSTLLQELPPRTQLRYAEGRALVGGGTAIQGASGPPASHREGALVRHLDQGVFRSPTRQSMGDP